MLDGRNNRFFFPWEEMFFLMQIIFIVLPSNMAAVQNLYKLQKISKRAFRKLTNLRALKALANGFNICFNILSILLNGNVESVCHPLSTLLKRVERMLNRC